MFMRTGSPFLFDDATGRIVGIKDADGTDRLFTPPEYLIVAAATRTFTSNTSQQAIFGAPANGALTLTPGVYEFDGMVSIDTMSATAGNGKFSLLGAGTATIDRILWLGDGIDAALDTPTAFAGVVEAVATQVATDMGTAGTATVFAFRVRGTFRVTSPGTLIPSFAQTTAAAAVLKVGSFFRCRYLGDVNVVSVGPWS